MWSRSKWTIPGYKEKFGDLSLMYILPRGLGCLAVSFHRARVRENHKFVIFADVPF
jgi:hypothetical protein